MNLFNIAAALTLNSTAYEKGLKDAEGKANSFGSKLKSGLGTAAKVGAAAMAAAGTAVIAFGTDAVKTGISFDSAMSQIAATMGMTTDDIKDNINGAGDTFMALREKAAQMGADTNFTATQAAEGLNILAMSGYDATQSIAMIEDVLHLAAAGSMDMASAAGYVSGAMKGFNDATKDSGYYADLMAKGATLANTSVAQLGEAMASGAAGAAAYNQSADSMTVALLRLAEQSEVGSAAGTSLAAAMKNIYTPTKQAKDALKELGVSAYDESGAARDFNTVVNELEASMAGMTEQQKNAYKQQIFGIQGLNAYNKMVVTGTEKQDAWAKALAAASDGAGEAAKQYDTMTDNLQGDIDRIGSAIDGFKIAVSDEITPTLREVVQFGADAIGTLTEAFQEGGLTGAMDALGTLLSDGLQMVIDTLPTVIEAGTGLLEALIQGIVDNLPQIAETVLIIIENLATSIGEFLPELMPAITQAVIDVANKLVENLPELLNALLLIIEGLAAGIGENADIIINELPKIIAGVVGFLTDPKTLKTMIQTGITLLTSLIDASTQIINTVVNFLPDIIEAILHFLLNKDTIQMIINAGVTLLTSLIDNADTIISTIVDILPDIIEAVIRATLDAIPQIVEAGVQLFVALIANLPQIIVKIVSAIPEIIKAIISGFTEKFSQIAEIGKNLISGLWDGIKNAKDWLKNKIKEWASGVLDSIKGFFGIHSPSRVMRDIIGKNIVFGLADGVDLYGDEAVKEMEELAKKVVKAADVDASMRFSTSKLTVDDLYPVSYNARMRNRGDVKITQNIYAAEMTPSEVFTEARIQQERWMLMNV